MNSYEYTAATGECSCLEKIIEDIQEETLIAIMAGASSLDLIVEGQKRMENKLKEISSVNKMLENDESTLESIDRMLAEIKDISRSRRHH